MVARTGREAVAAHAGQSFDVILMDVQMPEMNGFEATAAIRLAEQDSPEYALVDLRLPGRSGLEIVRALRAIDLETKIVVLTGYGSIATALDAVRLGATNYISKPADVDDILTAFARGDATPSVPPAPNFTSRSIFSWPTISRSIRRLMLPISSRTSRVGLFGKMNG